MSRCAGPKWTPRPAGIRNQPGVTVQSMGANGADITHAALMTAVTTLLADNRQPTAVVSAPRTSKDVAMFTDSNGRYLDLPRPLRDVPWFTTNQVGTAYTQGISTDTSEVYVGQWNDLLLGIRLGFELRLHTERYADVGQYAWRLHLRLDVQHAHRDAVQRHVRRQQMARRDSTPRRAGTPRS